MIPRTYKPPRYDAKRNPAYLAWIRSLPCAVCRIWGLTRHEHGKVEAAHVGARGIGQKCADTETLPLCVHHHRTGPHSHHYLGRRFWPFWKINRYELIAELNQRYQKEKKAA